MFKIDWAYMVVLADDKDRNHVVHFRVKSEAMDFAKAMVRMGARIVQVVRPDSGGGERIEFTHGETEEPSGVLV